MIGGSVTATKREIVLLAVVAALLYQTRLLFFFYLTPLHILALRRGTQSLTWGIWIFLAAILLTNVATRIFLSIPLASPQIFLLEFSLPALTAGGLWALSTDAKTRRLTRFVCCAGVSTVVLLLIAAWIASDKTMIDNFYSELRTSFSAIIGEVGGGDTAALTAGMEALLKTTILVLLSTIACWYSLLLGFNWLFAIQISALFGPKAQRSTRIQEAMRVVHRLIVHFRLPPVAIWTLIIGAGVALLHIRFDFGPIGYVVWNAATFMALLYTVQGVGLLLHIFRKRFASRRFRLVFLLMIAALLFVPILVPLLMASLALLGMSEHWVRFRPE